MLFFMFNRNAILAISALVIAAVVVLAILYIKKFKKVVVLEDLKDSPKKDLLIGLRDNASEFSEYYEPLFVLAAGNTGRKEWVFDSWNNAVASLENNAAFKKAFADVFGKLNSDPAKIPQKDFSPLAIPEGASKKEIKKIKKANKKIAKKAKKAAKKANKANKKAAKIAKSPKKSAKLAKKTEKANNKLYVKMAYKLIKYLKKAGIGRDTDETVTADETTAEKYDVIGTTSLVTGAKYDVHIPYWALTKKTKIFASPAAATENAPAAQAPAAEVPAAEAPVEEADVAEAPVEEAPVEGTQFTEAAPDINAAPEAAPAPEAVAAPAKKISKRKAKKLAKKEKKANKKAAKKAKKAAKKGKAPEAEFTIDETTILVAKGAIK